ncbi:MAG: hypothetical protein LUP99_04525 [Methanomicrobiales archaeon]|nr:hypothetical protein [Methanomicrobiales archaeon]
MKEKIVSVDCGKVSRGYRLVRTANYDRSEDVKPEFRCEICSQKKTDKLRRRGIRVE